MRKQDRCGKKFSKRAKTKNGKESASWETWLTYAWNLIFAPIAGKLLNLDRFGKLDFGNFAKLRYLENLETWIIWKFRNIQKLGTFRNSEDSVI